MTFSFDDLKHIENDLKRNEATYQLFDEDKRLKSRAGNVEYLTTMNAIKSVLKPNMKILDVGAATDVYSIPLAKEGHSIVAYEPSRRNYEILETKVKLLENENIQVYNYSSYDLVNLSDNEFDTVLLFGPLYHLSKREEQLSALSEAKRVCKSDGYIFVAFINHDMIPMTETVYNVNWFESGDYNHDTLRIHNNPFVFHTLDECKSLISESELVIERIIASDGFSELLAKQLNEMSVNAYEAYLKWHYSKSETFELLGATNHFLFVCKI